MESGKYTADSYRKRNRMQFNSLLQLTFYPVPHRTNVRIPSRET